MRERVLEAAGGVVDQGAGRDEPQHAEGRRHGPVASALAQQLQRGKGQGERDGDGGEVQLAG
ncbi:MAG: hypothetical protein KF718_15615 [Polyangiaceae bacterium]|nr:hypothetical protein [Polyangiaceae bacterium]